MTIRSLPLVLAAASAALVLSLTGCAGSSGSDSPGGGADHTSAASAGTDTDVFTVQPGDCVNDSDDETVTELPVVDCAEPHDFEAFTSFDLDEGDYPGADAVSSQSQEACAAAMGEFVGVAYDDSKFDVQYLTPTEDSWQERDDRTVVCLVYDPAGPLTGSVENSGV